MWSNEFNAVEPELRVEVVGIVGVITNQVLWASGITICNKVGIANFDPARLLQGTAKFMRRVKLKRECATDAASLSRLIEMAYSDIKARVENG